MCTQTCVLTRATHVCRPGHGPAPPPAEQAAPTTPSCEAEDLPLSRPCLCILVLTLCHPAVAFLATHACHGPELGSPLLGLWSPMQSPSMRAAYQRPAQGPGGSRQGLRRTFQPPGLRAGPRPTEHQVKGRAHSPVASNAQGPLTSSPDALNILQSCHLTGQCGQGGQAWPEHPERGMWGSLVLPADVRLTPTEFGSLQKMDGPTEQCQDPVPEDAGTCLDDSVRPRMDRVGVLLPQPRG